jgi:alpha-mannosidase
VLLHALEAASVRLRLTLPREVVSIPALPQLTLPAEWAVPPSDIHSEKTVFQDGCQCDVTALASNLMDATKPAHMSRHFWEKVLLCQFHDVLPGSSIEMVHKDSKAIRFRCMSDLITLLQAVSAASFAGGSELAASAFTGSLRGIAHKESLASTRAIVGWNYSAVCRDEFVTVPASWLPSPLQVTHDGLALVRVSAPAYGGVRVSTPEEVACLGVVSVTQTGGTTFPRMIP